MIRSLGLQRVLVLGLLVLANAVLGTLVYVYFMPHRIKQDRELRASEASVATLRADIDKLQIDMQQFEQQKEFFDQIAARGFMNAQNRRTAETYLKNIQSERNVVKAAASIKAGVIEENRMASKAKHKVLNSPIIVVLQALDDSAVYKFIHDMQYEFDGHISVYDLHTRRVGDVTGPILRGIATGTRPPLVEAKIMMEWRNLIPDSELIGEQEQGG